MSLAALLEKLEAKDLDGLRLEWRRRYGAPPQLRSDTLLRSALAWRIQAEEHGGIDPETRKLLMSSKVVKEPVARAGTVIGREWLGVRHEVEVTPDGFLYKGKSWRSLSEIARAITGSRWNGPRFFGLREQKR